MKETLDFVVRHGYTFLYLSVLAEQIGMPIPSLPMLLAMGALAGSGKFSYPVALLCAAAACLTADLLWYWLGVYRGSSILKLLCKISLEPDSCVRRTENMFIRYGARGLLFAKFVPGLSTAAAPLAGMFRMPIWKFVLADMAGASIWAGAYSGIGFVFRNQLDQIVQVAVRTGGWFLTFLAVALAGFLAYRYIQRRRFFHQLRISRIDPAELHALLEEGDRVTVIDLRNSLEWEEDGATKIPGAFHVAFEHIESGLPAIPGGHDVVLYCT